MHTYTEPPARAPAGLPRGALGAASATDEVLMARIASGGPAAPDALATLHARYAPAVARLVRRRLPGGVAGEVVEDLVQETFWRLWRAAGTYDAGRGRLATWLLRVATNLTIGHWRASARRPAGAAPAAPDPADPDPADPDPADPDPADPDPAADVPAAAWRAECRRVLRAGLAELPPAQRHAIVLAYYGGRTHAEIAAVQGAPLSTVKTRLALGLRKLAGHCAAAGLGPDDAVPRPP